MAFFCVLFVFSYFCHPALLNLSHAPTPFCQIMRYALFQLYHKQSLYLDVLFPGTSTCKPVVSISFALFLCFFLCLCLFFNLSVVSDCAEPYALAYCTPIFNKDSRVQKNSNVFYTKIGILIWFWFFNLFGGGFNLVVILPYKCVVLPTS